MTKPTRQRPAPLSVRLTPEERQQLEQQAAGEPLGSYVKSCVFSADNHPARLPGSRGQHPVKERKALAALLALFGQSRIASNLATIARLATCGALPLTPELIADLQKACGHIAAVKALLIRALGHKP